MPRDRSRLARLAGALLLGAAGVAACADAEASADPVAVEVAFLTPSDSLDDVDSPAAWRAPDGSVHLFATAKGTHVLLHYDGVTGRLLGRVAGEGSGPGELRRPNGVFVHDDLLIVVERDNRRVQVLDLPDLRPLGSFGDDVLLKPYGISAVPADGGLDLWITDDFDVTGVDGAEWTARIKRFRLERRGEGIEATFLGAFGEAEGPGRLTVVESILADDAQARLLVADEDEAHRNLKIYDLEGRFTGEVAASGVFAAEPEGLALYRCGPDGYIVSADQSRGANRFHVLDRDSLERLGTFVLNGVANTDGVALLQASAGAATESWFYAVHDDQAVGGVRWSDVAEALGLRSDCAVS
jgi:3-phytase